jgi:hypothetical protein
MATATVVKPAVLLTLRRSQFVQVLRINPEIRIALEKLLYERQAEAKKVKPEVHLRYVTLGGRATRPRYLWLPNPTDSVLPPRPVCASRSSGRLFVRSPMQMLFRTMSAHYLQAAQPSDGCACAPPPRWLPVPLLGRAAHSARRTVSRMAQCAVFSRLKHCPLAPCRVALSVL